VNNTPFRKGGKGDLKMIPYRKDLKAVTRDLRKNMTDAEKLLWSEIRSKQLKGVQFYRQKPLGSYIVDFYCPSAKLIIEVDGGQHYSDEGQTKDAQRDAYFNKLGLRVKRYSDREVLKNINDVLEDIYKLL